MLNYVLAFTPQNTRIYIQFIRGKGRSLLKIDPVAKIQCGDAFMPLQVKEMSKPKLIACTAT